MNNNTKNKILSVALTLVLTATVFISSPINTFAREDSKISSSSKTNVKIYISNNKDGKYTLIKGKKYSAGIGNSYFLKTSAGKVKWSTSNSAVLSVSKDGKLTLKKVGKAKIVAIYKGKKVLKEISVKPFNGGKGTKASPYKVANVMQYNYIGKNLSKNFVLVKDINFKNTKVKPIGIFVPKGNEGEDAETPITAKAFTGNFDGNGHKLSNMNIGSAAANSVGIFGCTKKASISNLKVENIKVEGNALVGGIIGYGSDDTVVNNITLLGKNNITGHMGMVGGIIGGSTGADVKNSNVKLDLTVKGVKKGETTGAGAIVGGGEDTDIANCQVSDSKINILGENFFGVGSIAGCAHESDFVKNCKAKNVEIKTGKNNFLIGGIVGYAGQKENDSPTVIASCITDKVTIKAGENNNRIGGIIGGGFYLKQYAKFYKEPTAFSVIQCTADGDIEGGSIVGTIAGYVHNNSVIKDSKSSVTFMGKTSDKTIGGSDKDTDLDKLN